MEAHELAMAALNTVSSVAESSDPRNPLSTTSMGVYSNITGDGSMNGASSNGSQSTSAGDGTGTFTPRTSTSDENNFSSQSTSDTLSQLSQLSQIAAAQRPLASTSAPRMVVEGAAAGQKRTADGMVKVAQSPRGAGYYGHSRNTSTVSNVSTASSSRIGEVSVG